MPPRDVAPGTKAPAKRPVQRRPRTPPQPTGPPFGALAPATAPLNQAIREATRSVQAAQQRLPARPLPAIPSLAHPTHQQAAAAQGLVAHSLERQASPNLGSDIASDPRAQRALAPLRQITQRLAQDTQVRVGLQEVHANPDLYGISDARNSELHQQAMSGTLDDSTRNALAGIGQHVMARDRSQATPGDPNNISNGGLLATVLPPVGLAKALARGDLAGAVAAINPVAAVGKLAPVTSRILGNAAKDAVSIPAEAIPSTYHLADTAIHDPGKALGELAAPYRQVLTDPVGSFVNHPLQTYLLAEGMRGAVGRGAGRVMRTAPEGSLPQRLASMDRPAATKPGTSLLQRRDYSPDVTRKVFQAAGDVRKTAKADKLRAKALTATKTGDPEAAQALLEQANKADPTRMSPGEIGRRMTERVDAEEQIRRMHRAQVTTQADRIIGKHKGAGLSLATQRIVQPTAEDLRAYRDEIAAQYPSLTRARLQQANVALRKQIDQTLADPKRIGDLQSAADAYQQLVGPMSAKLGEIGLHTPEQVDMAPLVPYATRNMGARFDYVHGRLVDDTGAILTPEAIRAHMAENGVSEPAYVTQAPHARSGYFVAQHEAPSVPKGTRTGEATLKGTFDASPGTLREGAARMQGLWDAHEGFARTVDEFGMRGQHGDVQSFGVRGDAAKVADELAARGEGQWRPIRLNPFAGRDAQLHDLLERTSSEGQPEHKTMRDAITAAIGTDATGPGPWGLIPEHAADELAQHIRVMGSGGAGKAFQLGNSLFRKTVLATSPKWLTGNTVEAGLRSAVDRAGPRSWYTMHAAHRVLADEPANRGALSRAGDTVFGPYQGRDPQAAEQLAARAFGGGHYAMADRMPRRGVEQFQGTKLEPIANALHTFWGAPGPKQAADLWHHWTQFVFERVNAPVERQFQMAMGGAHVRRNLMDGQMVKTSQKAIADAANGLTNTNAQVDLARAVDRAYGRYSKMSPGERRVVMLYTPFMAWTRNALHFVGRVLPRDHPVLTSALAAANQASEGWRKQHGLDLFETGSAPAFLQGSIPVSGGGKLRISRYTPFGLFDDLPGTAGGQVLPQLSGALSGLQGQTWTGRPLPGISGQPANPFPKAQAAALALVEATVPLAGQIDQYMSAAGNPAQRLRKVYDPFAASRPKPKQSRSSRRTSTRTSVGLPAGSYSTGGGGTLPHGSYSIGG